MFTNRDLRKIIIPLVIEFSLARTISIIDSAMVSYAGDAAVSGVSLIDTLNLLFVYMFTSLSSGGAVIVSQSLGAEKKDVAREAAKQLLVVAVGVAVLITVLLLVFRDNVLNTIFGGVEPDVMKSASDYLFYTAIGYSFLAAYNACSAIFRSMGNTRISMFVSVFMNVLNMCGNAILIFGFKLGAAGAAISTMISHIVGAGIMLVCIHMRKHPLYIDNILNYKPDFKLIKRICGIAIPNGLENGMFQLGKVITQSLISGLGTVAIAANAVANALTSFQYIPGNAINGAMIPVVGRCVGAGDNEAAVKNSRKLLGIAYGMLFVIVVFMIVFSKQFVGIYGVTSDSAELARYLLIAHSIFAMLIWPVCFILPNTFRAAGDVRYMMVISVAVMWICRIGFSVLFVKYFDMGAEGVWYAMFCDWIVRMPFILVRYLRGTWLTKYKAI